MFLNYCQNYQNIYKIVSVDPDGKNSRIGKKPKKEFRELFYKV